METNETINSQNKQTNEELRKKCTKLAFDQLEIQFEISRLKKIREKLMEEFTSTLKILNSSNNSNDDNDDNNNKL